MEKDKINYTEDSSKDTKDDAGKKSKKSKKSKHKNRKRKYSSSSGGSECESSAKKSKHKKKCKKRHKHAKDKKSKKDVELHSENTKTNEEENMIGPEVPGDILKKSQSMAPMSKEEWEKRQNQVRRVFDEETGRTRLIKGDGEVIEEIVSRDRHKQINRQATQGDGDFFQSKLKKMT